MLSWLRSLLGQGPPSRREMMACRDACDALEARIDQHYAELKSLRGTVNATLRHLKSSREPSETTEDTSEGEVPNPTAASNARPPSAHLARRFRIGG